MPRSIVSRVPLHTSHLVEQVFLGAVALALVVILSFPAARGGSTLFGWVPFWLLALPLSAWGVARALRRREGRAAMQHKATVHTIGTPRRQACRGAVRVLPRAA